MKALKIGRRGAIPLISALWENGVCVCIFPTVFSWLQNRREKIRYAEKVFINSDLCSIPSSEELYKHELFKNWWHNEDWGNPLWSPQEHYRLTREMSHPVPSPPETKAIVYKAVHWRCEYQFQWQWVRAYLQLIWSTGVLLGQCPKRNITLVLCQDTKHEMTKLQIILGMPCGHLPRGQGDFGHGALLFIIRKMQFFLLFSLACLKSLYSSSSELIS